MENLIAQITMLILLLIALVLALKFAGIKPPSPQKPPSQPEPTSQPGSPDKKSSDTLTALSRNAPVIKIYDKGEIFQQYHIPLEGVTIGRSKGNDIVLTDLSVSRKAFSIGYDEERHEYFLNILDQQFVCDTTGKRLDLEKSITLNDNDAISFGASAFKFTAPQSFNFDLFNVEKGNHTNLGNTSKNRIVRLK